MRKIVVFASLLAAPAHTAVDHASAHKDGAAPHTQDRPKDPRAFRIKAFFERNGCPMSKLATDFVHAADKNGLDWRLLPSITFVESSGGKHYRNNNVFGWGNGNTRFPSVRSGIHLVAAKLGKSALYRHKNVDGILRTYNPYPAYAFRVKSVMQMLGSNRTPAMVFN